MPRGDPPGHEEGEQRAIRVTIMRGGTSKGLFFRAEDLPPPGPARDTVLKALMGSEDLLQIDGLGGSRLVTAKLAIIGPSSRPDADVDYTYGIVPPGRGIVVFTSNCGNISAGVGPFAIDEGLVAAREPITPVRIHNTNTGKILVAHVPVTAGRARVKGDFAIPGVPGSGAEIFLDYSATAGAKTGRALPTGRAVDVLTLADGRSFRVTLGDVANPAVFVAAEALGLCGSEMPDAINADAALLATLQELRGRAAAAMGLVEDWGLAETVTPALPMVMLVAPPADYLDAQSRPVSAEAMDLRARMIFYNRCHESMPGTGSMCMAAMSRIPGTVVAITARARNADRLSIGHPLGVMEVTVRAAEGAGEPRFERLGFGRTARRLMEGLAFVQC